MAEENAGVLDDDSIEEQLAQLPEWERDGDEIVRTYEAKSFLAGIGVVDQVADLAEEADHHPDIDIRWRTLRFALSTHSEGGLTQKDFALARKIESLL